MLRRLVSTRQLGATAFALWTQLVSTSGIARAENSPYCDKVRARAASDAALLVAPSVVAQAIRFPSTTQVPTDTGPTSGNGFQVRTGLTYSPIDLYRGGRVLRIGDADCEQHQAAESVEEALAHGSDSARLAALRQQAQYLDARRGDWQALRERAEERLGAHVITRIEFDDLRRQAEDLEHKDVRVRGEMALLDARGSDQPPPPVDQLAARYAESSLRFERETSTLRSLDPWQFQLSGGVIPFSPVDWYAMAQVTFNVGSFERNHHERQYVDARKDELDHARHEISTRVREYREQLRAVLDQARRELEVVERELAFLSATQAALEKSEAQGVAHVRDTMYIEQISLESDRIFLHAWISALASSLEDSHG
jgi:hypothetical protein